MRLKAKFLLSFALMTAIALIAVSFLGYFYAKKQMVENINSQMVATIKQTGAELDSWLLSKTKLLDAVDAMIGKTAGNGNISKAYLEIYTRDSDIYDMYIAFADGRFLDGGGWVPPADYDARTRDWYKNGMQKNALAFSDPYQDVDTGKYVVTATIPLKGPAGNLQGILAEDIFLQTLTEEVKKANVNGQGYGFLIDRNGTILAHPDQKLVSTSGLKNRYLRGLVEKMLARDHGLTEYNFKGTTELVAFQKLSSTGWVLGIMVPRAVMYQQLVSLSVKYMILNLIALLLVALAAIFFAHRLTRPIIELRASAEKMAAGDLTVKASASGQDEVAHLVAAFNQMGENLRSLLGKINSTAGLVSASSNHMRAAADMAGQTSEQIASTISELANAAGEQADSVQKGVAMLEGITGSIDEIRETTEKSVQMTEQVKSSLARGFQTVVNQTEAMEEIKRAATDVGQSIDTLAEKSQRIGQIVEVIREIANQTNLLALNAAIEAARAGEQGRGFAVVADEVRKLAEQAAASSEEITALIGETQAGTARAVQQMNATQTVVTKQEQAVSETRAYFNEIKGAVEDNTRQAQHAAAAIQQLVANVREVEKSFTTIASLAQKSAASTQEVAAGSEEQATSVQEITQQVEKLAEAAQRLLEEVQQFTI